MTIALPELTAGWAWTSVEEVGSPSDQAVLTGPFGTSMGTDDFVPRTDDAVPVLTIGCLRESGLDLSKAVFVGAAKARNLERYQLRRGDILFSRMATVGRAGFVEPRHEGALFNYHIMRLRLRDEAINPRFFIYFVRGSEVVRAYVRDVNHGMTRDGINTAQLLAMPVPLAPRAVQERIVEAVDSCLTRLEMAVASIESAQRKLKAYRASVLKAAVEGRLVPTEAALARAEKRNYEHAAVLLKRILVERRRRWEEAELAKLKAAGKSLKDDKWKAKYEDPEPPDTKDLPELPEGWCWASPTQVASEEEYALAIGPFGSNLKVSDYTSSGTPLVFVRNIRFSRFDGEHGHCVSEEKAEELRPHWVDGGDILITKMGDPPGDCCIYPASRPRAVITADCIKLRLNPSFTSPRFFLHSIRSPTVQRQIHNVTKGVAQKKISLERFRPLAIPMAPAAEQSRIVDEVERLESVAMGTLDGVERELGRVVRLRQAVLKWAFEGKLVDQDPSDQPAEKLLERIRAERAEAETPEKTRRARNGQ